MVHIDKASVACLCNKGRVHMSWNCHAFWPSPTNDTNAIQAATIRFLRDSPVNLSFSMLEKCIKTAVRAAKLLQTNDTCESQVMCKQKSSQSAHTSIQGTSSTRQWIVLERCILQKLPPAALGCHKNRQAPQCVSPGILNIGVKRLAVELPRHSHVPSDQKKRKVCWVTRFPKDSPFCSTLEPAVSSHWKHVETTTNICWFWEPIYIYIYPRKQISRSCATNSLLWSKHQTQRNLAIVYSFPLVDPDAAASRRTPPWKIERLPAKGRQAAQEKCQMTLFVTSVTPLVPRVQCNFGGGLHNTSTSTCNI